MTAGVGGRPLAHVARHAAHAVGRVVALEALAGNDLWEKPPSYSPVPYIVRRGSEAVPGLRKLLKSRNAAARRWAAHCLAEIGDQGGRAALRRLLKDAAPVVRLQAAAALATLGDARGEARVLEDLGRLDAEDLPFALHFLVPFRSDEVRRFLFRLLTRGEVLRSEVLPLLGRQATTSDITRLLEDGLARDDEDERAGAVTGLSFQTSDALPGRLIDLYTVETPSVRRRLLFALGRLLAGVPAGSDPDGRMRAVDFLRQVYRAGDPDLRFAAALALLGIGDTVGLALVRERASVEEGSADAHALATPAWKVLQAFESKR